MATILTGYDSDLAAELNGAQLLPRHDDKGHCVALDILYHEGHSAAVFAALAGMSYRVKAKPSGAMFGWIVVPLEAA